MFIYLRKYLSFSQLQKVRDKKKPLRDPRGSKMSIGDLSLFFWWLWYFCKEISPETPNLICMEESQTWSLPLCLSEHIPGCILRPWIRSGSSQNKAATVLVFTQDSGIKQQPGSLCLKLFFFPGFFLALVFTVPVSAKRFLRCNWEVEFVSEWINCKHK